MTNYTIITSPDGYLVTDSNGQVVSGPCANKDTALFVLDRYIDAALRATR